MTISHVFLQPVSSPHTTVNTGRSVLEAIKKPRKYSRYGSQYASMFKIHRSTSVAAKQRKNVAIHFGPVTAICSSENLFQVIGCHHMLWLPDLSGYPGGRIRPHENGA